MVGISKKPPAGSNFLLPTCFYRILYPMCLKSQDRVVVGRLPYNPLQWLIAIPSTATPKACQTNFYFALPSY